MSLGPVIQEEPFTSISHYPTHFRALPSTTAPVNFTNPFVTSSASIIEPSVPAFQDVPRSEALAGHSRRYSGSGSYSIGYPSVSQPASSRHMSSPALFSQPDMSHMNDHTSYRTENPTSTSSGTSPTNTSFAPQVSAYQHFLSVPFNQNRSTYPSLGGDRRLSQPSLPSQGLGSPLPPRPRQLSMYNWPATSGTTNSYYSTSLPEELQSQELEATRGMLAMANPSLRVSRGSHDSAYYTSGHTHSAASSISGSSYTGMPEYTTTDLSPPEYHDISRSLPQPNTYIGSNGEDARSMMHRFNSRPPSNSKKNHVCRICGKTFARPSSLTTHTYSHTGQKPFKCEHEGCGKKFNVVSNLRRHYKVHKTKK